MSDEFLKSLQRYACNKELLYLSLVLELYSGKEGYEELVRVCEEEYEVIEERLMEIEKEEE